MMQMELSRQLMEAWKGSFEKGARSLAGINFADKKDVFYARLEEVTKGQRKQ